MPAGLLPALYSSIQGLDNARNGLGVVSENIAGIQDEGQTRRRADTTPVPVRGQPGLSRTLVLRASNEQLFLQTLVLGGSLEEARLRAATGEDIETLFGGVDEESRLGTRVQQFQQALEHLAAAPDAPGARAAAVTQGEVLAGSIRRLATSLDGSRDRTGRSIAATIGEINDQLGQLGEIGTRLATSPPGESATADLLDQRDRILADLSKHVDIRHDTGPDGRLVVSLGDGRRLVDGPTVHTLEYGNISPATSLTTFPDITLTDNNGSVEGSIRSGRLRALLDLRDEVIPARAAELNQLALAIRDTVRSANLATGDLARDPGDSSGHFFTVASVTEASLTLEVHSGLVADDSLLLGSPADTSIARDLVTAAAGKEIAFAAVAGGVPARTTSLDGYAGAILGEASQFTLHHRNAASRDGDILLSLEKRLEAETGIDLNEEVAQLLLYQQSFAAASRVIGVTQLLLDQLADNIGR